MDIETSVSTVARIYDRMQFEIKSGMLLDFSKVSIQKFRWVRNMEVIQYERNIE